MSYNICALSGKLTNNPMICIKTGLIFDKNAIEQFIESSGICPITNIPINKDDFCEIENERIGCVNNNNSNNLYLSISAICQVKYYISFI